MSGPSPVVGPLADRLRRSRRLDWRYLLPGDAAASLNRRGGVVTVGRLDAELADALGPALGGPVAATVARSTGESPSLLVGVDPGPAALWSALRAFARLAPTGVVYVETRDPLRRLSARAVLAVAGWRRQAGHAHWPRCGAATAMVPLRGRGAQQLGAATRHGREAVLLRSLARAGLLGLVTPSGSIVAVRSAAGGRVRPAVLDALATGSSGAAATPVADEPVVLITPRHAASRHVVALTSSLVAKAPRLADDDGELRNEHAALALLQASGSTAARPELRGRAAAAGRDWLVESRLAGELVDRRATVADPARLTEAALAWLARLPRGAAEPPAEDGRAERLWAGPLRRLAARVGDDVDWLADIRHSEAVLAELAQAPLPVAFEHGDLRPPNLVWVAGGLAVLDWELAEPAGLPLHDLCYLLDHVTTSVAARPAGQRASRSAAGARPGGPDWADAVLGDQLRSSGLGAALLRPLLVASWARRVCSLADRAVARGTVRDVTAPLDLAWLSRAHPVIRWREALALVPEPMVAL